MSRPAIEANRLCKQYHLGLRGRQAFLQRLARRWRRNSKPAADQAFWALRDVSFEVPQGQVLGIIGHNGSGKSTLLKILSRTTEPTSGSAVLRGRVGSLLEVGSGFHPDLTGRENIFLNGAILGMRVHEIRKCLDSIVEFAKVERFLDTPVKRYSSGMYMRLAFAVAAHLESEILIVDEVLAVGDAAFQQKCLDRMREVSTSGRTVLFVSHNMLAVEALCAHAMRLDAGRLISFGTAREVVHEYLGQLSSAPAARVWDDPQSAPGTDAGRIHRIFARPQGGEVGQAITISTPIELGFEFWNFSPGAVLTLSVLVYDEKGTVVFNTHPEADSGWTGVPMPAGLYRSTCQIPARLLNDGVYRLQVHLVQDRTTSIFHLDSPVSFVVADDASQRTSWFGKYAGVVRPALPWTTEQIADPVGAEMEVELRQR